MSKNRIHSTAIVHENAQMGVGNVIGPGVVIAEGVILGDRNWIGPYAVLGTPPEMRDQVHNTFWEEEKTHWGVSIGSSNIIREFSTVHAGYKRATVVSDNVLILRGAHVGHDAAIGPEVTLSCNVLIGGFSIIFPRVNIGLGAQVHQNISIGTGSMIGMGSAVRADLSPFSKVLGNPARLAGVNRHALIDLGFSNKEMVEFAQSFPGRSTLPIAALHRQWEKFVNELSG